MIKNIIYPHEIECIKCMDSHNYIYFCCESDELETMVVRCECESSNKRNGSTIH